MHAFSHLICTHFPDKETEVEAARVTQQGARVTGLEVKIHTLDCPPPPACELVNVWPMDQKVSASLPTASRYSDQGQHLPPCLSCLTGKTEPVVACLSQRLLEEKMDRNGGSTGGSMSPQAVLVCGIHVQAPARALSPPYGPQAPPRVACGPFLSPLLPAATRIGLPLLSHRMTLPSPIPNDFRAQSLPIHPLWSLNTAF